MQLCLSFSAWGIVGFPKFMAHAVLCQAGPAITVMTRVLFSAPTAESLHHK